MLGIRQFANRTVRFGRRVFGRGCSDVLGVFFTGTAGKVAAICYLRCCIVGSVNCTPRTSACWNLEPKTVSNNSYVLSLPPIVLPADFSSGPPALGHCGDK